MKKTLSIILAILMIVTVIPLSYVPAAAASSPTPYDGVPVTPQQISKSNYKALGLADNNWSQFNGYYAIRDAKELYGFAAYLTTVDSNESANAVLLQDIVINTAGSTKEIRIKPTQSMTPGAIAAAPLAIAFSEGASQPVTTPICPTKPQVPIPDDTGSPFICSRKTQVAIGPVIALVSSDGSQILGLRTILGICSMEVPIP